MASLTNAEIGSVVYNMIDGIPVGISGIMTVIVDQQIYFAEQFTGDSIGTSVGDMYQPGIMSLTAANVLSLMEAQGLGTKAVTIGELSISKGMNDMSSKSLREDGIQKLKAIGERISYYQTFS